jgi:large subunit ribosomal protein L29
MAKKDKVFVYAQADTNELSARLDKSQQELFKLRFRSASAPLKDTMQIRKLRREVARLHTFINQRSANPEKAPASKAPAAKTPVVTSGKAKGK